MKGIIRFGQRGKLHPRYVGPFEILKKVGKVAYELALSPQMSNVHNVFHISMLKKYYPDILADCVIEYEPLDIQADFDLCRTAS